MNFDLNYMISLFPELLKYVHLTLIMALIAMFFAIVLGLILAVITRSKVKIISPLASLYISFFRGTPTIVQIFLFYFGLPQLFPAMSFINAFTAVIIGLSFRNAAYLSEVFRAAITSVDNGQLEAGLSVGMTKWQTMRRIVLPQATRIAIPSTGNFFIILVKETSLAFTVGVAEIFAQAKMSAAATYKFFESFLAVAIVYWIITVLFTMIQTRIEVKLNKPYR
ncbi:amino acid ABC transporter permease [Paenibacillus rigui]|uniref:ABC transporter permease n=1 Tax=Paenibacillus rigui TaxID=554312 RepID=A0A229URJ2_9BACL|nr:amino acid ABC transporter permease [Paenibacillus rigui]OXM85519.1 ABC transporter permease [Paenibacillus rigui]